MQKFFVESDSALEKADNVSSQRELFIDQMEEVSLKCETYLEDAYEIFNEMPEITLPPLPWGYLWARSDNEHSIIRDTQADDHRLKLILYGPNADSQINFLFQVDGVTTYSFAHTSRDRGPTRLEPPVSYHDYYVPGFNYSRAKYKQHVRGHLIDLRDTIQIGSAELWSANDPRNFVPEPPVYEWGMGIRNQKVQALRRLPYQTAYAQFTNYPEDPLKTNNKSWVPDEVFFTSFSVDGDEYERLDVINVNWDENMKRPAGQKILDHAARKLTTSIAASPVVKLYSPDDSDRTLRYFARDHKKTADGIANSNIKARFPVTAELFARFGAADREFEKVNDKLRASITADEAGKVADSIQNINRSLNYAEDLSELDEEGFISSTVRRQSLDFIKDKTRDDAWNDEDLDDITDRLRSLSRL